MSHITKATNHPVRLQQKFGDMHTKRIKQGGFQLHKLVDFFFFFFQVDKCVSSMSLLKVAGIMKKNS